MIILRRDEPKIQPECGAGGSAPKIFRSPLPPRRFFDTVQKGVPGTPMPAFEDLLKPEQIWQIHAFTSAYDRLP